MNAAYDFGYSWIWTSGHLIPLVFFGLLTVAGYFKHWKRWKVAVCAALALWAGAGYLIVHRWITSPMTLPTEQFFTGRQGQVLDIGAGSGRTTIMVLQARPQARVMAFDLFDGYYGIEGNTPERLRANVRLAGFESRLDVQAGDMRNMPFADASMDAAVSAYAIDHLRREGRTQAFRETLRVLKPGGEMLLMVLNRDNWIRVAYPLFPHGYYSRSTPTEQWSGEMKSAGFEIAGHGFAPGTLYIWAKKASVVKEASK